MKKIALLISDNLLPDHTGGREDRHELVEEFGTLAPALAAHGMELVELRWREAAARAAEFDAILPLMVWDYFEGNEETFLAEMAKAEQITPVFNGFNILRWNVDKAYLDEMEDEGAPTIRTTAVERVTKAAVAKAFEELDTDVLVIKPTVGGGAWRQVKLSSGDEFPPASELPPAGALLQAFLPSVLTEGEYSFLYFGGRFSHAVRKTPKDGDYRIQSIYGGREDTYSPTPGERETGRSVLDTLDFNPLYARVDLIRGRDGNLKLIELELIEPYLYLPHAPVGEDGLNKGAKLLAAALAAKLSKLKEA